MQSQITLSLIGRCNGKKQQMAPLLTGSDPTFLAATSLFNLTSNHSPSSIFVIDFLSHYLIFRKCNVSFHCYTADLSIKPTVTLLPTSLFDCILEIQVFSQSLTKYFTWGQSNLSACLSIYLNADSSVQTTTQILKKGHLMKTNLSPHSPMICCVLSSHHQQLLIFSFHLQKTMLHSYSQSIVRRMSSFTVTPLKINY